MAPTWKQIEARRELRLWITQVLVPGALMGLTAWSIPEVRTYVKETTTKVKNGIKSTVSKIKSKFTKST